MRDMMNNIHPVPLFAPKAAATDNTPIVSAIIDRLGYDSVTLILTTGTETDADATFTTLVEDGDQANMSDHAAVDDENLLGTEVLASFGFADDVECRKIGYIGYKRYIRVTVTPAANDSGNIFLSGVAILGHPRIAPTANPPQ